MDYLSSSYLNKELSLVAGRLEGLVVKVENGESQNHDDDDDDNDDNDDGDDDDNGGV